MKQYDRVTAPRPEGVEQKRAHIVGGGLAGLSAAAFLATDGCMPGEHITVYELLDVVGGSMDAAGSADDGFTCRGERELEANMECLWYLFSKVPSLIRPGRTVLDETREANIRDRIDSNCRVIERRGQKADYELMKLGRADLAAMFRLIVTSEERLEDLRIKDWFSPAFTTSNFWYCWSTMLAFKDYHSLIEARRYLLRFMHYTPCFERLNGILHAEFNEFDSMIKPLLVWLRGLNVRFVTDTEITDLKLHRKAGKTTVTGLKLKDATGTRTIALTKDDLVFVTNGSMTQNATTGSTHTVAAMNADTRNRGCFTLWEKLAARNPEYGDPSRFISNVEQTSWMSFFVTVRNDPRLRDHLEATTGNRIGTGGAITIKDSAWLISFVAYGKYYPDQPENVNVLWGNALYNDRPGDFIRKPMRNCTGAEILRELLYHLGLEQEIESIVSSCRVATAMMPYITSQFMPRKIGDRPQVIPAGSTNLAFIGQFVELPGDVVFTVETSVRTAMMAAYGLLKLDKPIVPIHEPQYDIRVIVSSIKKLMDVDRLSLADLPELLLAMPLWELVGLINKTPAYPNA